MSGIHLPPVIYDKFQVLVHNRHQKTYQVITHLLQIKPGETVVEIGCGTGLLAEHFISGGYDYWGFDPDEDRIKYAKTRFPQTHFIVGYADAINHLDLPHFEYAYIHGILHHLPDGQCQEILKSLFNSLPGLCLVIIEPFKPSPWWKNPIGVLFAQLDEGNYIRTYPEWLVIFGENLDHVEKRTMWPRWPVPFINARLLLNPANPY